MTRTGKIARLPRTLRDQLNQRLHDGEKGRALIAWLNALPEVQSILTAEFDGSPINGQNLTEWKRGGYRDWVAHQEALCIAERLGEDAAQLQAQGNPPFTETLAIWLAARYSVAARQLSQCQGQEGWRLLREFCADVVRLRRGDHSAQRLRLEREQLELHRQRQHAKTKSEETPLPPEVLSGEATAAEQRDLVRQEASMPTAAQALASSTQQAPASPPATTIKVNQTKSNQIKPNQTRQPGRSHNMCGQGLEKCLIPLSQSTSLPKH